MSTREDSDSDLPLRPVAEDKIRTFEDVPGPNGRPLARIDGHLYYIEKFNKTTIYYKCYHTKFGCRARAIMKSYRGTHRIELKHFHECNQYPAREEAQEEDMVEEDAEMNQEEYEADQNGEEWGEYQEAEDEEFQMDKSDLISETDRSLSEAQPPRNGKTNLTEDSIDVNATSSPSSSIAYHSTNEHEGSPEGGSENESELYIDVDPSDYLDQDDMEDDGPPELEEQYAIGHDHNTRKRRRSSVTARSSKSIKVLTHDEDISGLTESPNTYKFNHEVHRLDESGKINYECEICGTAFPHRSILRKHLSVVHQKEQPFKCSHCPKTFTRPDVLKRHEKDEHHATSDGDGNGDSKSEMRFKCPHCVKTFGHESSVKSHIMLHFGIKPFRCTWAGCDKAYSQKTHLTQHLMVHSGERPYVCRVCNEAFRISSHCRQHEMRKHQLYEPRPRLGKPGQSGQSSPE